MDVKELMSDNINEFTPYPLFVARLLPYILR